jgi:integrase
VNAVRPALAHLLYVLREEDRIAGPQVLVPPAIHDELKRFDAHLDAICGLAPATRISRRMWVAKFLADRFGCTPVKFGRIKPSDIVDFLAQPTNRYRPGTARVLGCALRSYLRFRALSCGDQVGPLVAAVPTVAQWRLATLPAHLTPAEVERFLEAFDRQSASGQRGYAMARCLVDMALRAGEVAAIQLDDLNWREGTLTIQRGKSRRADILPLPVSTGEAIVQYLRQARPKSTNRALFLRHQAPFDAPIAAEFVRGAVRRAFGRCGLGDRFTGTHVLRHTAAMRMRCAGATLKEIADVLRHRSLDTTTIHSKVDLPRLAAVAAPWPGGLS